MHAPVTITAQVAPGDRNEIGGGSLVAVALHDVSIPIHPGMIIYRNNPGVELESTDIAGGTAPTSVA